MPTATYNGELQHPYPERIEEAKGRCGRFFLVIGKHGLDGCFKETCVKRFQNSGGGGAESHCGILTRNRSDLCPIGTGEETKLSDPDMQQKKFVIQSFKAEFFSAVQWWGEPDPEENG